MSKAEISLAYRYTHMCMQMHMSMCQPRTGGRPSPSAPSPSMFVGRSKCRNSCVINDAKGNGMSDLYANGASESSGGSSFSFCASVCVRGTLSSQHWCHSSKRTRDTAASTSSRPMAFFACNALAMDGRSSSLHIMVICRLHLVAAHGLFCVQCVSDEWALLFAAHHGDLPHKHRIFGRGHLDPCADSERKHLGAFGLVCREHASGELDEADGRVVIRIAPGHLD